MCLHDCPGHCCGISVRTYLAKPKKNFFLKKLKHCVYRSPYVSIEDTFGCFSAVDLTFRHCLVGKTGKATNVSTNISTWPGTPAAGGGAGGWKAKGSEVGIPSMLPLARA